MIIIAIILVGMVGGWIANFLVGQGRRSWPQLFLIGIAGSFVGGLLGSLLFGDGLALRPSGIVGSIIGAVVVVLVLRAVAPSSAGRRSQR
jgi:uncharacterized membrane protein YeaQ/YmgE (transglycosylase-associated protein family)